VEPTAGAGESVCRLIADRNCPINIRISVLCTNFHISAVAAAVAAATTQLLDKLHVQA